MKADTTQTREDRVAGSRRWRRRILFCAVYFLFLAVLGEVGARAFWKTRGVPFFTAHRRVYRSFYPMLPPLERAPLDEDKEGFDVLLLGGSALHLDYGDIEHVLRERLCRALDRRVRVHNLSAPAHTSLDSYYKYKHLADKRFDLVVVYHGINEVRANNCPASTFRSDYSHFAWYKLINDFERRADARWFILPYTIEFVVLKAAGRLGWSAFLPTHEPAPESLNDGCDVKTEASFRRNLEGILETAAGRDERVVLMTYAFHVPPDYAKSAFDDRVLDYTVHLFPIELWGRPDCVVAGIRAHNAVVTALAATHERVLFVDQNERIPHEALYFNDICHLTHEGSARFADHIVGALLAEP
jgi:hypothetical protein